MKIVIIEPDGQGGLFHFAHQMGEALGAEGNDVTLVTDTEPELRAARGYTLAPMMRLWKRNQPSDNSNQTTVHKVARLAQRGWRAVRLTAVWWRTVRAVERMDPDVVILSIMAHRHILRIAARLAAPNRVFAQLCHEATHVEDRGKEAKRRRDPLMERFDRIFFLASSVREDFLARTIFPEARTTRIPHPRPEFFRETQIGEAEMRARLGLEADAPVLLFFGNLWPSKGVNDLVDAFAQSRARENTQLLIAGRATKNMDMAGLRRQIADHGLGKRVIVANRYIDNEEVYPIFRLARAVVLPYRTAAASGVLHQSFAYARAPIVTRLGGLAEDVRDGETGLIVPPRDPGALAAAMDRVIDDPALAERLGKAGHDHSETHFSWAAVAGTMGRVLAEDVNAKRTGALTSTDAKRPARA